MTQEHIVDEHLAAILDQVLDVLYQAKQAAWSATQPQARAHLQDLVTFLIDQSRVVMEAEERIDGRAPGLASPSSHQRGNIVAEANGDLRAAASVLADRLDELVDDIRARAATVPAAGETTMLADLADGLALRRDRIRSR